MASDSLLWHCIRSGGNLARARLSRWRGMAGRVAALSQRLDSLTPAELKRRSLETRWRAKSGEPLESLLLDAYALMHQACQRALGLTYYPVQVMGALGLFEGGIVEMQTGEGKTLTALMPAYLRALPGRSCHVVTVNDYLAQRDADWSRPAYELLGLTVGCIQSSMETDERREAYSRDVTYSTSKELGFDFLRDRLRKDTNNPGGQPSEAPVQRGTYFALIDEADSVLIDDARTPLIIAVQQPTDSVSVDLYRWASRVAPKLENGADYLFDPERRAAWLTTGGCRRVLLMGAPPSLRAIDTEQVYLQVERALTALYGFLRDRDYLIVDDEIVILDESTGRIMEGRKWQEGLHQAIEAKELLPITPKASSAAQITVQRFFRQYEYLAGMTGTGVQVAKELKRTYGLKVAVIPTHRDCRRVGMPYRMFTTRDSKLRAVAQAIDGLVAQQRAVLVGTPSVEASELLSAHLTELSVEHQILNARFHKIEADIVSAAGQPGKVTIATNMAGRGTDIKLHPEVGKSGGLHVIATEMHSSYRIDRQLIGRSARQGDLGTFQFFLSLEDELLYCLTPERVADLRRRAAPDAQGELAATWQRIFLKTQRLLERMHARQRGSMLKTEKKRIETYERMGLDPYLEMTE